MPGRFEIMGREPLIVIDGAHNVQGAVTAAATLRDDFHHDGETILVVGMLSPRDPMPILEALEADAAAVVVASSAPSPRAIPPEQIAKAAEELGTRAIVEPDIAKAVERARRLAAPSDAILVTGSLWFIGAARAQLASAR